MKIGLIATAWENPGDSVRLVRLAEEHGIESVWFGEHSHLPVGEGHAFVDRIPEFYRRIPDPYVVLSGIASATSTLRIGTAIALPGQGDALNLAKTIASLDQLSGGRFEWGVGYGWNKTEIRDHGLDPRHRMSRFAEVIAAVRHLWTEDIASFDGAHVQFGECWSLPKPVQSPHPPILLGCRPGPRAFGQLVEHCDGWLPSIEQCLDGARKSLQQLRARFAEAGRDPASLRVTFIESRGCGWTSTLRRIGPGVASPKTRSCECATLAPTGSWSACRCSASTRWNRCLTPPPSWYRTRAESVRRKITRSAIATARAANHDGPIRGARIQFVEGPVYFVNNRDAERIELLRAVHRDDHDAGLRLFDYKFAHCDSRAPIQRSCAGTERDDGPLPLASGRCLNRHRHPEPTPPTLAPPG